MRPELPVHEHQCHQQHHGPPTGGAGIASGVLKKLNDPWQGCDGADLAIAFDDRASMTETQLQPKESFGSEAAPDKKHRRENLQEVKPVLAVQPHVVR